MVADSYCRYMYLAYNTVAEIVTVVTVPRDLHETPAIDLWRRILNGAEGYLSSHGADHSLIGRVTDAGSTTIKGRYGGYAKSKKQADGTIKYKRSGVEAKVMIVIEDLWIEGQYVKVCILVCLDESPRFRNPKARYEHDVEMKTMARCVAENVERDSSQSYYGQIKYRGHRWVGDLTHAFFIVWRANKRRPTRYPLIQNVWSSNRLPKSIGLKMSDFIPEEDLAATSIPDGSLSFDAHLYTTAEQRYEDII
ncbi:hypothetical protein V1517DRAFT_308761 [Lipomyces orientalis]|uniref:Uncharacterized protein n=1 Tax=Lipomyces orientalis TaxID=1233043 RepID=A0ACC3TK90_9ASCO